MQPYLPRTRVGDKMMCPMCATNEGFRTMAASNAQHPHEVWQQSTFGCAHVSQGRRLASYRTAALSHEEQEAHLERFDRDEGHGPKPENAPFKPNKEMIKGARAYNSGLHLPDPHEHSFAGVTTSSKTLREVGRAFDALPVHQDHALPHFEQMRKEVNGQYHHLTHNMGIKVNVVDHDPYKSVHEMTHDLLNNKRLNVLGTHVTGGHNYFSNDENDKFRAVHDAFGHAATGRGFDAHGEEAAFAAHSKMFTHHALPAMASETRGQNAYLHLNGDFPDQKIAVLPSHMWSMATDLSQHRSAARWAVRTGQAPLDTRTATSAQGIRHFIAKDMPHIVRIAHDSGDSITVFHCPFCGSGQVIARSDGSIECEFCHSSFTVQVQPEFSAFPQSIGGVPVDVPGMGPDQQPMDAPGGDQDMGMDPTDPMAAGAQTAGGAPGDEGFPPGQPGEEEDPDEESEEDDDDAPPFVKKKSFRTAEGHELSLDAYLQHLALITTRDRTAVLRRVQAANGVSGR